jgi:hypothetical protein
MLSEMSLPTTIFLILLGIVGTIGAIIIWATKNAW